jgi:hypothetical protein
MPTPDPMCPLLNTEIPIERPNKNTYSPDIGPGSIPNMPLTDILVVKTPTVSLTYNPPSGPDVVLTLRNPQLNDQYLFQVYRIQRYSRGDSMLTYRDKTWFKTRVHNWAFVGLTRQNRIDILNFVKVSAGQFITVVDYYGQSFEAIIINPDNPVTQELPDYLPTEYPSVARPRGTYGCGYTWKVDLQRKLSSI